MVRCYHPLDGAKAQACDSGQSRSLRSFALPDVRGLHILEDMLAASDTHGPADGDMQQLLLRFDPEKRIICPNRTSFSYVQMQRTC